MFGFIRLNAQNVKSTPEGAIQEIIVSREDIYRHDRGREPILLLRRGFELTLEELPKLLVSGAKVNQFQYKASGEALHMASLPSRALPQTTLLHQAGTSNPLQPKVRKYRAAGQRAVVLEPNQKNLKRIIDCLFNCSFSLDQIHPVRLASATPWAIDKYRPSLLIVAYELPGELDGLTILKQLAPLSYIEQLILITSEANQAAVRQAVADITDKPIHILTKPITRFDMGRLLLASKAT